MVNKARCLFGSLFAWVVCENRNVPPRRVRFFKAIFAFWTEVGYGLRVAVEDIYIFI